MQKDNTRSEGSITGQLSELLEKEELSMFPNIKIHILSQSHIDLSWHWNDDEALEMVRKTFEGHLDLLDKYPDFTFMQSQLSVYKWIEEYYPDLFARVTDMIKAGRWIVVGGQWVEPAEQIISSESMARQLVMGQLYSKEKFGVFSTVGWSPDDGGHDPAKPQLFKSAGINAFIFKRPREKIFKLPQIPFLWEGLDGTKIVALRNNNKGIGLPQVSEGYIIEKDQTQLSALVRLNKEKNISHICAALGVGDTGGVNHYQDLEYIQKCEVFYSTPTAFFAEINKNTDKLETVKGTLPTMFTGTFTTHQDYKQFNRQVEDALYDCEVLNVISWLGGNGFKSSFKDVWEKLLFNQFHDIAWGATTTNVDDAVLVDLKYCKRKLKKIRDKLSIGIGRNCKFTEEVGAVNWIVFNTLPWEREGIVAFEFESGLHSLNNGQLGLFDQQNNYLGEIIRRGSPRIKQNFRTEPVMAKVPKIPGCGHKTFKIKNIPTKNSTFPAQLSVINNNYFYIEMNPATGGIRSLFDKTLNRELIKQGEDICLWKIYEEGCYNLEYGVKHKAWELGCTGKVDMAKKISVPELVESNSIYNMIRSEHCFGQSVFKQKIFVYNDMPLIEVQVEVDWHELETLARLEFPLAFDDVEIIADTQFGSKKIKAEGEEFAARNWVALQSTKDNFGVAIFNDSIYGHSCTGSNLRLSVIRSSTYPSECSDKGSFKFRYAIVPFKGDVTEAKIPARANEFYRSLFGKQIHSSIGKAADEKSFISWERRSIIPSAIKATENGEGIVVRAYECCGKHIKWDFCINSSFKTSIQECNLIEQPIGKREMSSLEVKPYMIKNILIKKK